MSKIYTKTGDKGQSSLIGGTRVFKYDLRLKAYGEVDELNSVIGLVRAYAKNFFPEEDQVWARIQSSLFVIGSHLACEEEKRVTYQLPLLDNSLVQTLEERIDFFQSNLPQLKNFILPAGSIASSQAHVARTVCRRVERSIIETMNETQADAQFVVFLNRLSDYFFALARYLNHLENVEEIIWRA
jgi:cob(I)alamin adenosyltransferase